MIYDINTLLRFTHKQYFESDKFDHSIHSSNFKKQKLNKCDQLDFKQNMHRDQNKL